MSITSPRASPTLSLRSMASLSTLAPPPLPKSANWWEYSNPMESSGPSTKGVEDDRFRRLIDVGSSLLSELDLEEGLATRGPGATPPRRRQHPPAPLRLPAGPPADALLPRGADHGPRRDLR